MSTLADTCRVLPRPLGGAAPLQKPAGSPLAPAVGPSSPSAGPLAGAVILVAYAGAWALGAVAAYRVIEPIARGRRGSR